MTTPAPPKKEASELVRVLPFFVERAMMNPRNRYNIILPVALRANAPHNQILIHFVARRGSESPMLHQKQKRPSGTVFCFKAHRLNNLLNIMYLLRDHLLDSIGILHGKLGDKEHTVKKGLRLIHTFSQILTPLILRQFYRGQDHEGMSSMPNFKISIRELRPIDITMRRSVIDHPYSLRLKKKGQL